MVCVCILILKELTWLQRPSKEVGRLQSIRLKEKDNAACIILKMQKDLHRSYTECS